MRWDRSMWLSHVVLLAALVAGCGGSDAPGTVLPPSGGADGLTVTFRGEPDPPARGDNTIEVGVKQADGSPVTDATVTASFSMPAMPSMNMPAMRSDATLQHQSEGRYRGTGQLSMGGTWNVTVTVARGASVATRRTSIVAKE